MRLAIVGAGPIGRASAALVAAAGHEVALWSPSGASLAGLVVRGDRAHIRYCGAATGRVEVGILRAPTELRAFDTVLVTLPGNAWPVVMSRMLDGLRSGQTVVVSGALSLSPLWLFEQARARGVTLDVVSWGTTLCTARRIAKPSGDAAADVAHVAGVADVEINTIRSRFEMATIPASAAQRTHALCTALFGDHFNLVDNILATLLSNVNPVAHAAEVLPNLSRIDLREDWPLFKCLTPAAARIGEAIDAERRAIAAAFGLHVRSVHEHTHLSYHVPLGSYGEMAAAVHATAGSPSGPKNFEHRYLVEDVPYGLAFYEAMGEVAGVPTPHTSAAITLLGAACERDYRGENRILPVLGLAGVSADELVARCEAR
jgi:opine dehydrogenase